MTNSGSETAEAWVQQGGVLFGQQRWREASAALSQAVSLDPANAAAWRLLGAAEQSAGEMAAAQQAFERALALAPDDLESQIRYAFLLSLRGRPDGAIAILQGVVSRAPQLGLAWWILGHALGLADHLTQAIAATERAVELSPGQADSLLQLADLLFKHHRLIEAEHYARRLITEHPQYADGWSLLGYVLRAEWRHAESLAALERAVALQANPHHLSKLLTGMQYAEGMTPERLLAAHREWDARFGRPVRPATPPVARADGSRPLRIGFLSTDFGQHPVGFLVLPAIEQLDRTRCQVTCYSDRMAGDEYTARFQAAADRWVVSCGIPDPQLAEAIRGDQIDILFDLAGHVGERLGVFARKPAPLQISWLGYVGTTGLATMDCLLADRYHVRPGEEAWYGEQVLRMPNGYACYGPPPNAPPVTPLPALTNGYVTFGSFNNPAKFSPRLFDAWAELLRRVPGSRLLVKFGWLDDAQTRDRLRGEFIQRGVEGSRVLVEGSAPHLEFLASYGRVDLALDTLPYSGGLTTCESLWMGVPVVTCPGATFASRHATSHLTNAGLGQFVAADLPGYIDLAASWANRLPELAAWRSYLRDQVRRSPLCDAPRFATDLLDVLSGVWNSRAALPETSEHHP
jgi:predicted O-linked N-acetylglucosamine transferase (SPINDLY family)